MTITKKYVNEMLRTVLVLAALLTTASAVDCNGKSFHCVNSTHFMICVDLGGGVSQAIENFFIACPPPTVCQGTNHFECEFPAPTTAATTLSNVISETTLPWEEVVTASSLENATKEFSENYINTEKITTTAGYSVTTDATVDWTANNASELNIYNEMNIPETETTLATEIVTTKETNQTVNENGNTTEYVPTVGAGDITTAVMENVTQITMESKNLTETEPVVVDNITAMVVETTTENIIITDTTAAEIDYIGPSATEQIAQTINENLNITKTVRTGIENVTQTTTESKNLTETEPVVVHNVSATVVETTPKNIIITDTIIGKIDYIAPSATEQVAQTINENLNITETVSTGVENVTQTTTESKIITETEPVVVDNIAGTVVETTTENIIIIDTTAAEIEYIAPSATEQVAQTINENLNITETVSTGVENVTQTTTESKIITETEPVVVDNIAGTVVETTTENIIITDTTAAEIEYIAPSATEQIAQTIDELNITETLRKGVENVTQTTMESKNLTETETVVVDNITATIVESTTENISISDTIAGKIDYIAPSATEKVAQTINENLNITETVPKGVENVTQSTTESKIITETEPVVVDNITAMVVETTTENIIITDTIAAEIEYIAPSAAEQIAQTTNKNLNITETVQTGVGNVTKTTTKSKNLTETEPLVVDNITATVVETKTDNASITDTTAAEIKYIAPSATEQIAQTINQNLNITETVRTGIENVTQTTTESMNLTETEPVVVDNISATVVETTPKNIIITDTVTGKIDYIAPSTTGQVAQTINENLNITETVPMGVNKDITTIVETVTQTTGERGILTQTEHVKTYEITATTIETTTDNIITPYSLGPELGYTEPTATEQITQNTNDNMLELETDQSNTSLISLTEEIFTTDTTQNIVTENIIPASQAINLEYINMDALLPTITNTQSMSTPFEDNMNFEILMPVTENIESTVNNGASTNGFMTLQSVNMDTLTTEAVNIPSTISNDQPMSPDFEEVMKTEPFLGSATPAIEDIFWTQQALDLDIITTGAIFIPTTVSSGQALAFEDITTGAPLPATENFLLSVNNGANANVFMTSHPINAEIINTEDIPNTITNAQLIAPTFGDNITTDAPLSTTENILSSVNNGASTNGLATAQVVNVDTINTETMYIPTTISNTQPVAPTFEENIMTNVSLAANNNILSSVNNGTGKVGITTAQAVNVDSIIAEAILTTITNASPMVPAFEENITTNVSLAATENILSSENNGTDTKGLTTAQAVNVDSINTDTNNIPITITNAPLMAPALEDNNMRTDVPLPAHENMVSLVNNGVSTNRFMTTQVVNIDTMDTDTMYISTTTNNAPPTAPTFGDNTRTETPLSALKNNNFPKKYEDNTDGFMITNPIDLEQITPKAGFETIVQLTTDKYVVPSKNVVVINEKTSSVYGDMITKESVLPVMVIIKDSPNTIIQKTEILLNSSTDTGVKLDAIETDVNGNYDGSKITTIDSNNMFEIGENIINHIPNSTVDSGVDESNSHVSKTGAGNTENALFPNENTNNQNEVISAINEETANDKQTAENENMQAPVNNIAISQTGASPTSINGKIIAKVTKKSIPPSGTDSAFDISTQNWMSQQGESKTKQATNNLQSSIVEHNDQADNIIWNPVAKQVFNNPNQNPNGTSSVTNINDNTNDRNAASLNSQFKIPVNMKTVDFATVEIDVSSVPTVLPAETSGANITIRDNIENTYKPTENSVNTPSGSSVVEADTNRMSQESMQAISNQDSSIASISITSDIKPEVKSSIVKDGNSDSPTVVHNNLPSQSITSRFELPINTHSFSEKTRIGTPMEGNKVIKENDTISKTVMLDLLPLPIKNNKFSAHAATKRVLMDLKSNSQAQNTVIITESYKSETLKPIFIETGIQDSGNGGDITPVPTIRDPAFNFQIGITDRTTGTTIVPTVGVSTSNSLTSGFAKTVSSATLNSQTRVTIGADFSSQSSQNVEKIPNKMAGAPNNADVVPRPKPGGSGIITNNPDNLHSPNSSNNVKTGIITESVSESNYESPKSENIMPPQVPVIGYQKNNTTVVTGLNFTSLNVSFGTEKAPPNSTGSDHIQTQQSNPSTKNNSSIFTPAQKISTSTARTPSQMATSNPISHVNNNLTKQVPTVAAQTFSCIYGIRGRYSDKSDCRKFYICIGSNEPVVGYCPQNTVFSDLKKLCTKNMSHCIRENQFKCPSVGRFSDFMKDNVYYICVHHKNHLYRFKFQCQKGYILDKTTVKCIETKEIESNESVSISSDNSSQTSSSAISSSTSSKSISDSNSTSKSSSRADDSSSKNDKSRKSKKNNEAEETSEKSEGNDADEDDEVFKCKEKGKFPIRNECRRYYLCKKGRRSEFRRKIKICDSDQVFHKNKKKCVDEDSYEC